LLKEAGEKMIEVEVRGDIEYAIRQLKKKLQMDGIKRELKRREYYEKPSVKKRRKQAEAKRKMRKFRHRSS
jgi:small subunit ribosomal protein S21